MYTCLDGLQDEKFPVGRKFHGIARCRRNACAAAIKRSLDRNLRDILENWPDELRRRRVRSRAGGAYGGSLLAHGARVLRCLHIGADRARGEHDQSCRADWSSASGRSRRRCGGTGTPRRSHSGCYRARRSCGPFQGRDARGRPARLGRFRRRSPYLHGRKVGWPDGSYCAHCLWSQGRERRRDRRPGRYGCSCRRASIADSAGGLVPCPRQFGDRFSCRQELQRQEI